MYFSNLDSLYSYSKAVLLFACWIFLTYLVRQRLGGFLLVAVAVIVVVAVVFKLPSTMQRLALSFWLITYEYISIDTLMRASWSTLQSFSSFLLALIG